MKNKGIYEKKRKLHKELELLVCSKGYRHSDTIKKSQELDRLIVIETKIINKLYRRV